MQRILLPAFAVLSIVPAGCMGVYAYPSVSYTPPVRLPVESCQEVRVFRVDIADDDSCPEYPESDRYVLSRLPVRDWVWPQIQCEVDRGWFALFGALNYGNHTSHRVRIRLYRPGWETIEVGPGEKAEWQPAATPEQQEEAVDALLSTHEHDSSVGMFTRGRMEEGPEPPHDLRRFRFLAAGTVSQAHREALLFAADEYTRLAGHARDRAVLRTRLEKKAAALRSLAAGKPLEVSPHPPSPPHPPGDDQASPTTADPNPPNAGR